MAHSLVGWGAHEELRPYEIHKKLSYTERKSVRWEISFDLLNNHEHEYRQFLETRLSAF